MCLCIWRCRYAWFFCDDWTKPNNANSGPTTCKRSHSTTVDRTAKIVEQKVELKNAKLLVDHPQSIADQPVTDGKRVPAVKLQTEPERQPKVQKETKNETKKIVKKGTPKTVSTPNNKKRKPRMQQDRQQCHLLK